MNGDQLDAMTRTVDKQLGYLTAVLRRMDKCGFPARDGLRELFTNARDAMHSLRVSLHYQTCDRMRRERDRGGK